MCIAVIEEAAKCMCNLCRQSSAARQLAAGSAACLQGLTLRLRAFREPELTHGVKLYSLNLLFLLSTLCPEIRWAPRSRLLSQVLPCTVKLLPDLWCSVLVMLARAGPSLALITINI